MSDDTGLLEELHRTRDDVHRWMDYWTNRFGSIPRPTNISEIQKPLQALIEKHPVFKRNEQRWFGPKQLHTYPYHAAQQLLQRAYRSTPEEAVAWLHKVYATTVADLRHVAEIHGLDVKDKYSLSNGVRIVPLAQLPASPMTNALKAQYDHRYTNIPLRMGPPPVVAVYEVQRLPATASYDGPHQSEVLERSVRAHVVASLDAAPAMGTSWYELTDTDLEAAQMGVMWRVSFFDGPIHSSQSTEMNGEKAAKVEAFLKVPTPSSKACDIAAERLILARRRHSIANKAIEGAICLEALLLGESPNTEMTFRMGLRAALLLGRDAADKRKVRKAIREFYRMRSKAVHGGVAEDDAASREIVAAGLNLSAQVLDAIVARNGIPDWSERELSGGNPDSRDAS